MRNTNRIWIFRALVLALFTVSACNLFNPSGEGNLPSSTEGKVSVGQSRLKLKDWDGAMEAFSQAIKNDSTNSMAYYGYAKAVRFKYDLNGLKLSQDLTDTSGGKLPFVSLDNETGTRYLQATVRINPVLGKLVQRDSLTRLYNRRGTDLNTASQDAFINNYLANPPLKGYMESEFPLMDGFINYEKIIPDLTLTKLLFTFVNLKDLNGDTLIDSNDNVQLVEDILNLLDKDLTVDNIAQGSQEIFEKVKNDPKQQEELNNVIDKISEGTEDISETISLLEGLTGQSLDDATGSVCDSTQSDTTCSAGDALTGSIQETIAQLGDQVSFYKFPDNKDNDGDGCVDEEIYDQKDNDGDGLIDEDVGGQFYGEVDSAEVIAQQFAGTFDPDNMPVIVTVTDSSIYNPADSLKGDLVEKDDSGRLTFTDTPGFWSDSLKNEDGSLNHKPRFIVKDALGKEALPPYDLGDLLPYAKENIGGCWNAY